MVEAAMMMLFLLFLLLPLRAVAGNPTEDLLRTKDQALLDAIAPGDRKVWDHALAADALYVDENGVVMDRAEFLKQLEPLPAGASGRLQIRSYSAHISGDLATVIHTDDEQENYHGQMLSARYLMTETWHLSKRGQSNDRGRVVMRTESERSPDVFPLAWVVPKCPRPWWCKPAFHRSASGHRYTPRKCGA